MRMPSKTMILLNGAVALVAVASVVTMGRSMLGMDRLESCRERYPNAIQWSVQRDNGDLLSSSDLQARLGSTDWNLIERVTVVKADHGQGTALAFNLAASGDRSRSTAKAQTGAGFEWAPHSVGPVKAACASYAVRFNRDFDFGGGGRLPGLFGGRPGEDRNAHEAFSARLSWAKDGLLSIYGHMPGLTPSYDLRSERREAELPVGQWVAVDQEVVLNTPGRSDGAVRVWLDGKLRFESRNLSFRTGPESEIRGVLAEVAYTQQPPAKGNGGVSITPFEFRW